MASASGLRGPPPPRSPAADSVLCHKGDEGLPQGKRDGGREERRIGHDTLVEVIVEVVDGGVYGRSVRGAPVVVGHGNLACGGVALGVCGRGFD